MRRPRRVPPHRAVRALLAAASALLGLAPALLAYGPPFPDPVPGRAVYDAADVLAPAVEAELEARIDAIEARVGAEVVVYTQFAFLGITSDEAEAHAIALMDQWGVGRRGFDDGLVLLLDLHPGDPCHGQAQLYAGPGFRATYLTNEERQAIFEDEMVPLLRSCELGGALLAAMARIEAAATPEQAAVLESARIANAVLGLVVAPAVLLALVGGGLLAWRTAGRDPELVDSASILLPAPPAGLTPAAGAALRDGGAGRRSLTAASLDLAVRGYAAFRAEPAALGAPDLGIIAGVYTSGDPVEQARVELARRRTLDPATAHLRGRLEALAGGEAYIRPERVPELARDVPEFEARLEGHLVANGWYRERPGRVTGRWSGRSALAVVGAFVAGFVAVNLPASGLLVVAGSLGAGGVALAVIGRAMPARTREGARVRIMLEAYRRTLERTMAQARSLGEVVATSAIPLVESPDDAVAWGVALGLQDEVEAVLRRSVEDRRAGVPAYVPGWYSTSHEGWGGTGGGVAPGLLSASAIPDVGGMMAALGTIGNAPASSSSGGGGFGGGSSGGGGGGAGGGF